MRMASFFRTRQRLESPMSIRLLEEIVDAMFQVISLFNPAIAQKSMTLATRLPMLLLIGGCRG